MGIVSNLESVSNEEVLCNKNYSKCCKIKIKSVEYFDCLSSGMSDEDKSLINETFLPYIKNLESAVGSEVCIHTFFLKNKKRLRSIYRFPGTDYFLTWKKRSNNKVAVRLHKKNSVEVVLAKIDYSINVVPLVNKFFCKKKLKRLLIKPLYDENYYF